MVPVCCAQFVGDEDELFKVLEVFKDVAPVSLRMLMLEHHQSGAVPSNPMWFEHIQVASCRLEWAKTPTRALNFRTISYWCGVTVFCVSKLRPLEPCTTSRSHLPP